MRKRTLSGRESSPAGALLRLAVRIIAAVTPAQALDLLFLDVEAKQEKLCDCRHVLCTIFSRHFLSEGRLDCGLQCSEGQDDFTKYGGDCPCLWSASRREQTIEHQASSRSAIALASTLCPALGLESVRRTLPDSVVSPICKYRKERAALYKRWASWQLTT